MKLIILAGAKGRGSAKRLCTTHTDGRNRPTADRKCHAHNRSTFLDSDYLGNVKGANLETVVIGAESEYELSRAEQVVPLIAEFFALKEAEVWERIKQELASPGSTVAEAWKRAAPCSSEAVKRFYGETDSYVFDLVVDYCHERRRGPWEAPVRYPRLLQFSTGLKQTREGHH